MCGATRISSNAGGRVRSLVVAAGLTATSVAVLCAGEAVGGEYRTAASAIGEVCRGVAGDGRSVGRRSRLRGEQCEGACGALPSRGRMDSPDSPAVTSDACFPSPMLRVIRLPWSSCSSSSVSLPLNHHRSTSVRYTLAVTALQTLKIQLDESCAAEVPRPSSHEVPS